MTFGDYVAHYSLARSEGLLLRYLSDAYKALDQTVPEDAKTEELYDLTEWLGELVRQVDSSLLDEWEQPEQPRRRRRPRAGRASIDDTPPPVTANTRAFRVLVRNELFRRVELAALRRFDDLGELDGDAGWTGATVAATPWPATSPTTPTSAPGPTPAAPPCSMIDAAARPVGRPPDPRRPRRRPRLGHHRRGRPRRLRRRRHRRRPHHRRRPALNGREARGVQGRPRPGRPEGRRGASDRPEPGAEVPCCRFRGFRRAFTARTWSAQRDSRSSSAGSGTMTPEPCIRCQ